MENKEILGIITAGAAVLPMAVVAVRRELPLRTAEVLHAVAATLLVTAAASAVYGLSYGSAFALFAGPGSDLEESLTWAAVGAGFAAGLAAWWLLHARPRTVAIEGFDDDAVELEPEPEPRAGADVVSDDLPPARPVTLPLVSRTLFLGVGLALVEVLPFSTTRRGARLAPEPVLLAALLGLIVSIPLLAAVLADEDETPDWPAYAAFAVVFAALLAKAFLWNVSPQEYQIVMALLAGLACGILVPAALDVLGDLTSAVRPYAVPVGVLLGGTLLALSVALTQHAVFDSYEDTNVSCEVDPENC